MLQRITTVGYSKPKVWCGPGALSALTGAPVRTTTELLSRMTGEPYEKLSGVYDDAMEVALWELGYRMCANPQGNARIDACATRRRPYTLAEFLTERSIPERVSMVLIEVTGHYITAHLSWACDNWTMHPVPIEEFPKPRRWVRNSWIIAPR